MHLDMEGLPHPASELPFAPGGKKHPWYLDFAWWFSSLKTRQEVKVALEVQGGVYSKDGGGHRSIKGLVRGIFKHNALTLDGWQLLQVLPEQIEPRSTEGIDWIKAILLPHWATKDVLPLE